MPEGGGADADAKLLKQPPAQLLQAQGGLLIDPLAQLLIMLLKARALVASPRFGLRGTFLQITLPIAFHAALGEPQGAGKVRRTKSTLAAGNQTFPQIKAEALHAIGLTYSLNKCDKLNRKRSSECKGAEALPGRSPCRNPAAAC